MIVPLSILGPRRRRRVVESVRYFESLEDRSLLTGNLQVASFIAPPTAVVGSGQTIEINWIVENIGDEPISDPFWFDSVYLSTDETLDEFDQLVAFYGVENTGLGPGEQYTFTETIDLSYPGTGERYLLLVTDDDEFVTESEDTDNILASAISLVAPDVELVVADFLASSTVVAGQTFFAQWTVDNLGLDPALAPFTNRIILSTDDFLDLGDQVIFESQPSVPLLGGGSQSSQSLVVMPPELSPGTYYLFFETDSVNVQAETNDFNNGVARTIEIVADGPDLLAESPSVPTEWSGGSQIDVEFTLTNQGSQVAEGPLSVAYYLSDDAQFDLGVDELIFDRDVSDLLPLASLGSTLVTDQFSVTTNRFGAQYLLIVVDSGFEQAEVDESNNVLATEVAIGGVNLATTNADAPELADSGATIDVEWFVENGGSIATDGTWSDAVYLSADATLDESDSLLGTFPYAGPPIGATEGYSVSTSVTLTAGLSGAYYLLFVTDAVGEIAELSEADNVFARAIEIAQPAASDLVVTEIEAPLTLTVNQFADISWTVTNVGDAPLVGSWQDRFYLSSDAVLDEFETILQIETINRPAGLAPNESYTVNRNIAIPDVAAGTYYFFVRTLATGESDGDTTNNVAMLGPITIRKPDLVPTQFDVPTAAVGGQTISVTYTVQNDSDVPMGASQIADRLVLSDDEIIDLNDQFLSLIFVQEDTLPLAAGGSYQRTVNVQLPSGSQGSKFLILRIDTLLFQGESNENNNILVRPIEITAPDLTVAIDSAPAAAALGSTISVSYTVTNQGDVTAFADWFDQIYLTSSPETQGALLAEVSAATFTPLAASGSYSVTRNVVVPISATPGPQFLRVVTNARENSPQPETNFTNNSDLVAIEIVQQDVNLAITSTDAPTDVVTGQPFEISWTVTNTGSAVATADWVDRVYLSDDDVLDASDIVLLVTSAATASPLGPGGSYTRSGEVTLDDLAPGPKYFIVRVDSSGLQPETNEADNLLAIPVTITGSDLVVDSIVAPASATFGSPFSVTYTVRNAGNASTNALSWFDRIILSSEDALDAVILSDLLVTLDDPLAPGETYTRTIVATAPPFAAAGNYRIGVGADILDAQAELEDENNVLASNLFPVALPPIPDLVITNVIAPVEGFTGGPFSVTWTVTNTGDAVASAPWSDRISILGPQFVDFGLFAFDDDLAPGESVTRTEIFTFPITEGSYVVTIENDYTNAVLEGPNESNTLNLAPIVLENPPLPDLVITSIVTPPNGLFSGSTVPISFTVKNVGPAATQTPVWTDYVILTSDSTLTFDGSDDVILFSNGRVPKGVANQSYLAPGESYTQTVDVTIPIDAAGPYYLYVMPNGLGFFYGVPFSLRESDRTNNFVRSDAFLVNLTPPPDLVVTQVLAPLTAFSGQSVDVSWTTTNVGSGATFATLWSDRVYLSADGVLDASDVLLTTSTGESDFFHSGRLNAGQFTVNEQTLVLPEGISGNYNLIVVTDAGESVFEAGIDNNNTGVRSIQVLLTPPPDLVVDSVSTVSEASAGHAIDVTYTVTNRGSTDTPPTNSTDQIYLSSDDQLDANDVLLTEVWGFTGSLSVGQGYTKTRSVVLSSGIDGDYFILVSVNTNNTVFEVDRANNILASSPIAVANLPANLVVSNVTTDSAASAGDALTISWTVQNTGTGDTAASRWVDKVFLSVEGEAVDRQIGLFVHDGFLFPGETYTRTASVIIPFDIEGEVTLYIVTDAVVTPAEGNVFLPATSAGGHVFEGEGETDNASSSVPITILRDAPDLFVSSVVGPAVAETGGFVEVSWTVQNLGGLTNSDHWIDDVYLSTDTVRSADDVYLGSVFHSGSLGPGGTYTAALGVQLSNTLAVGNYFFLVQADRVFSRDPFDTLVNRVEEGFAEANNVGSSAVAISLASVPDLLVSQINVPETTIAGRTLDVSWTVTNNGPVAAGGSWSDVVYLSTDQVLDTARDRYLGSIAHGGGLAPGASYQAGGTFDLPGGLTGPYYVFVRTDAGDIVFERDGEGNNSAYDLQAIDVLLGQPVDFTVGSIDVPANATPGSLATIAYTVQNNVNLPVPGGWTDAIYLSADEAWDPSDIFFARVRRQADLASGESYSENVTAALPVLPTGAYRVIIRTDILNNVVETNDENNLAVSLDLASVDATPLELGVAQSVLLAAGGFRLYRVDVEAGQTLRFSWDSQSESSATEMYVRFGAPPTRAVFDLRSDDPFAADQEIVVANSRAGTYFVLVRSSTGATPGDILAESVPFSVSSASPGAVGNAGPVTLEISGARFTRGTTFELVGPDGIVVQATFTSVADQATAFATFDLRGRATGSYDIVARSTDGALATADDAVLVTPSLLGGVLTTGINVPDVTLAGSTGNFTITYSNTGDADIVAPLLTVRSSTGTLFGRNDASLGPGDDWFAYGAVNEGPAGILRPGQSITIPFVFQTSLELNALYTFELLYFEADDTTPIDWSQIEPLLPPQARADANFDAIFAEIQSQIGATVGDLVRYLSRLATLMPEEMGAPTSRFALLALGTDLAWARVTSSISGSIVADDLEVDVSGRAFRAINVETGSSELGLSLSDGSFVLPNLAPGTYRFSYEGGLIDPDLTVEVLPGQPIVNVEVPVSLGARVTGSVRDETGGLVTDGQVILRDANLDTVRTTPIDSLGVYLFDALPLGSYVLEFTAPGLGRTILGPLEISSIDELRRDVVMAEQASLIASVSLSDGGVIKDSLTMTVTSLLPDDPLGTFSSIGVDNTIRIGGLATGSYDVTIRMDGYLPFTLADVTVTEGQTRDLGEITLIPAARVTGTIRVPNPSIVDGFATVVLSKEGVVVQATPFDPISGAFTFDGLESGDYELRVSPLYGIGESQAIQLSEGETLTGIELAILGGRSIIGQVTRQSDGAAVANIPVQLFSLTGASIDTLTDVNGNYRFDGRNIGDYTILVGGGGPGSRADVSITELETAPITANLVIASIARITGQLTTQSSSPISSGLVTLRDGTGAIAQTTVGSDGRFEFLLADAGTYSLEASSFEGSFVSTQVTLAAGETQNLSLVAGARSVSFLIDGGLLSTEGAFVTLLRVGGVEPLVAGFAIADETGIARLANLIAGDYVVAARTIDGSLVGQSQITVEEEDDVFLVTLQSPASLRGVVRDSLGTAIAGASVTVVERSSGIVQQTTATNAAGAYELTGITEGIYDVIIRKSTFVTSVIDEVVFSGSTTLEVALTASDAVVQGNLLDETGAPIAGGTVRVIDALGRTIGVGIADAGGAFRITTVIGTGLRIEAFTQGHRTAIFTNVSIDNGQNVDLGAISLQGIAVAVSQTASGGSFVDPSGFSSSAAAESTSRLATVNRGGPSGPATFSGTSGFSANGQGPISDEDALALLDLINVDANVSPPNVVRDRLWLNSFDQRKIDYDELVTRERITQAKPEPKCEEAVEAFNELKEAIRKQEELRFIYRRGLEELTLIRDLAFTTYIAEFDSQIIAPLFVPFLKYSNAFLGFTNGILSQAINLINLYNDFQNANTAKEWAVRATSFGGFASGSLNAAFGNITPFLALGGFDASVLGSIEKFKDISLKLGLVTNAFGFFSTALQGQLLAKSIDAALKHDTAERAVKTFYDLYESSLKATVRAYLHYLQVNQQDCCDNGPGGGKPGGTGSGITGRRSDPNDIVGPTGFGDPRFVSADQTLDYTIRFENRAEATLPVQTLTITTQLDDDLDWRTLRFGSFGFQNLDFSVPTNQAFLSQRLDLTDSLGFFVDVIATVDVATGIATWTLSAIDPATGEEPVDDRIGFLPPNLEDAIGEGFVTYSVRAKSDAQTGDVIDAQATIIFDTEPPLDTPIWTNMLDADSPTSQVTALPEFTDSTTFLLSWLAEDSPGGAGLASTSIYVSANGDPYLLLLTADASVRQYLFEGEAGVTYAFLSVATDLVGNRETSPTTPDTLTSIIAPQPTILINAPSEAIAGQQVPFSFEVLNVDPIPNIGYLIQVDWDNDGIFDSVLTGVSDLHRSHSYSSTGPFEVRAAVFSLEGEVLAESVASINVLASGLVVNEENDELLDLVWAGTSGDDVLVIEELNESTVRITTLNQIGDVVDVVEVAGATGNVVVYVFQGNDRIDARGLTTKSLIADGGEGDDTILGGAGADRIEGDSRGPIGNDEIDGGNGDDMILADGSEGYDSTDLKGHDTVRGGDGNDTILGDGAEGSNDDFILGGDGNDAIYADGAEGYGEGAAFGMDTVEGGLGDDFIQGDGAEGGDDELKGNEGNDIILGGGGRDLISGGLDRDIAVGGSGEDIIAGEQGSDLILAGSFGGTLDESSILLVQAEWISSRSLAERVANLRGTGTGERSNGSEFLNEQSVQLSDDAVDTVLGGEDGDWLLADMEEDLVSDVDAIDVLGLN